LINDEKATQASGVDGTSGIAFVTGKNRVAWILQNFHILIDLQEAQQ
jgi:hypothetical protein